ncbi:dynamin family protein [Natronosporangium hydrolyticum]|uniref:Dynamin family protein n=1 Tax=Natronosporangium hydrolyticum TaxID=2811111 RepID=A0A895Y8G1_9ACTN|nr:dynamin family protein [Natronosporangium hydrolyticum]QSB13631.1 dynamin family protein [Natronosporangium hydrolyticum]
MTGTAAPADGALPRAIEVVDLGLRAAEAYGRADLATRLTATRGTLADPVVHVVVVGEFKQGKSSLVNALVGANVCPVDDDVATAIPTHIRFGAEPAAQLLRHGDPPQREPIPMEQVRQVVLEDQADDTAEGVAGVEVRLPRQLLSSGLVMVDTPGVGGLGSLHAAASVAAASMADALVFVTDAAQELTRSELDFLHQARQMCGTVICVLTKTDLYPQWRKIRDLDTEHLRDHLDLPIIPVSSTLRLRAVAANDKELNTESGFPELVRFLTQRVSGGAANRIAAQAAVSVVEVCEQIESQFEAERAALADPAAAAQVVDELTAVKQRVEAVKTAAAKWNQTLSDGVADLTADIDHDLRARIRRVIEEADDAIEAIDPADTWDETERWLQARVSHELLANYKLLRDRATWLSEEVSEHFREAAGEVLRQVAIANPVPLLATAQVEHKIELEKMKLGKQAMVALKSAYGGALMFVMLGAMSGISLGPIGLGIGLVMGRKGLRDEKKRQRAARQTQARNAVRRYCDEVSFVMNKDSRDTLRRIQRQLRDHYSALADELSRSNTEALAAASAAAKQTSAEREGRLRDLAAELDRLRQLREHAAAVLPA